MLNYREEPLPSTLILGGRRCTPHMHLMLVVPANERRPRDLNVHKTFHRDLQQAMEQYVLQHPEWNLVRYGQPALNLHLSKRVPNKRGQICNALQYPFKGVACKVGERPTLDACV